MKTRLQLAAHLVTRDTHVIELWHDGRLIGTVAGTDGPGVRIFSKYPMRVIERLDFGATEVRIDVDRGEGRR